MSPSPWIVGLTFFPLIDDYLLALIYTIGELPAVRKHHTKMLPNKTIHKMVLNLNVIT